MACVINWITSSFGIIASIQTTSSRSARSRSIASRVARSISGSSGAPAQQDDLHPGANERAASTRWTIPFCRVMRPTKSAVGMAGRTP